MLKLDLYCCHECLNTTYASGLTKVCCKALSLINSLAFQSLIPEALDSYAKGKIKVLKMQKRLRKLLSVVESAILARHNEIGIARNGLKLF